jgi:hypothetical protein
MHGTKLREKVDDVLSGPPSLEDHATLGSLERKREMIGEREFQVTSRDEESRRDEHELAASKQP